MAAYLALHSHIFDARCASRSLTMLTRLSLEVEKSALEAAYLKKGHLDLNLNKKRKKKEFTLENL